MAEAFVLGLLVLVVSVGIVRTRFCDAMISARFADLRIIAVELENLVLAGRMDSESKFYRYFHATSLVAAKSRPHLFPSFTAVYLHVSRSPAATHGLPSYSEACADGEARYREHLHLARAHTHAVLEGFRYTSGPFWLVIQVLRMVGFGAELTRFVQSRLVGLVGLAAGAEATPPAVTAH